MKKQQHTFHGGSDQRFANRTTAGRALAACLTAYAGHKDTLVLALPRGGVPVAFEVASALRAPLDLALVRKLGVPYQKELALGAIGEGGVQVLNPDVIATHQIPVAVIQQVVTREAQELARRRAAYRGDRPPPVVAGRTVILVDDGIATGATMRAAVDLVRAQQAARVVVAAPVIPLSTVQELGDIADDLVFVIAPVAFGALGFWYEDFHQVSDDEVRHLLVQADARGDLA
ncbi:phosphoribosyltransferase [Oscillochloris trichoides DG-6]|uniref:Phosphoribosyltransferase n=1 Tax=Oscillochloris trichoides DG-6 TaxID=765420 RepID=E1IE43_9CHLR|nr:phosphoribosyltransferase family protein [Oscillochloris trichoides]EFO80503.1 phosphoribosyltransferase [Oscillochloris trichoides DG-6]